MSSMSRNPTSRPIPPSTCWQDAPPRSAQQTRRPRQAGQAGYQGEALAQWQPGLLLVMRVAALIHQQAHPQATLPGPAGRQLGLLATGMFMPGRKLQRLPPWPGQARRRLGQRGNT
jgi:hypothetical protein